MDDQPDLSTAIERLEAWCAGQGVRLGHGEMGPPILYADVRAVLAANAALKEMAAIAREIGEDVPAEFVADGTPTRARQAHAYKAGVFDRVHLRAKVASTKYNTFRETANVGQR